MLWSLGKEKKLHVRSDKGTERWRRQGLSEQGDGLGWGTQRRAIRSVSVSRVCRRSNAAL